MRVGLFGLMAACVCATSAHAQTPKRYADLSEAERLAVTTTAQNAASLATKIERLSSPFVGTTYAISPLGEGSGVDPDPRLRWDKVDCLTFVETSMALSLAPSPEMVLPVLDDIRYGDASPAFNTRNHFVESQWVPNNLAKGYIRSISREVAGAETKVASKTFGAKQWHKMKHPDGLKLSDDEVPTGTFSLDIVPIDVTEKIAAKIPNGTLLFVVRADSPRQSTRTTHVGFVVEREGKRFLRHASKNPFARVVDEPFWKFLARNKKYDKWPVEGFALFEVIAPGERLSKLTAAK